MKTFFRGMAVALLLVFSAPLCGQDAAKPVMPEEESSRPSLTLELDWASKYIYNGIVFNNQPVMLGDLCFEFHGFYVGALGVYNLTHFQSRNGYVDEADGCYDSERKWRFEEVNYYAGYYYTFDDAGLGSLTVDFTWTYFHYPTITECNSADLQLSVALEELYKTERQCVSTKLTASYDYELEETWVCLGGVYTLVLDDAGMFELELNGDIYWGDAAYMRNWLDSAGNGFSFAVIGRCAEYQSLRNGFFIAPYVSASYLGMDVLATGPAGTRGYGRFFNSRQELLGRPDGKSFFSEEKARKTIQLTRRSPQKTAIFLDAFLNNEKTRKFFFG